jgi:hypothetical protein
MNDGHPIEDTRPHEVSDDLNLRRRRLLRGAIGIAPVVLTLRSGAVAAVSSCTGTKLLTSVDRVVADKGGRLNPSTGAVSGDTCITGYDQTDCPIEEAIKIRTGQGSFAGTVRTTSGGKAFCNGTGQSYTVGQQIAILSSNSASSFMGL